MRQCEIYLHGIRCGILTESDSREFSFIYDRAYLLGEDAQPVSLTLPLQSEPQIFALKNGLFKEGMNKADTHNIGYEDFVEFGRRIGLNDRVIKQDLKMFQEPDPKAIHLIEKSFLSEELKKQYIASYKYRCKMLTFLSITSNYSTEGIQAAARTDPDMKCSCLRR